MRSLKISVICAAATAAISAATPNESATPQERDLVATASAAGSFATLVKAVRAAGLEDALQSDGPFTILAPTDAAFAALPDGTVDALLRPKSRDALTLLLQFHVIPGRLSAADIANRVSLATLSGDRVAVELRSGRLEIDGTPVITNDVAASNGVIHAIDSVLIPPGLRASDSRMPTASDLIELAIDRGVPLFNAGQHEACAAIYEVAAWSVLSHCHDSLPREVVSLLADAARSQTNHAAERAWQLRRALDVAYEALESGSGRAQDSKRAMIIDEFGSSVSAWRTVNDSVMGGVSDSEIERDADGHAVFSGNVSLDHNGGFASVRRAVEPETFEGFSGVELRVRGDGNRYYFSAAYGQRASGDSYRTAFDTRPGEWIDVRLDFSEMRRSIRGYVPPRQAPLAPERIQTIGILISDKQEGPFRLEIDHIRATR